MVGAFGCPMATVKGSITTLLDPPSEAIDTAPRMPQYLSKTR